MDEAEWTASLTGRCANKQRAPRWPLDRKLGVPQSWCRGSGEETMPGIKSRTLNYPARNQATTLTDQFRYRRLNSLSWIYNDYEGRDNSVGIATGYELDGPGIESRWRQFSAPVQPDPGANPASYTTGTGSFPGVKRPGRGVDHQPQFSAEVKEGVQLYLYSPSRPSWPVVGWPLPLYLYFT
jgi:hypothetical protein